MRVHYPKVLPKDGARIFIFKKVIDFGEMDESKNEYESLISSRTLMSRGQTYPEESVHFMCSIITSKQCQNMSYYEVLVK